MPERPIAAPSDRYFVKELAGENPPTFTTLKRVYDLASAIQTLRPWNILQDDQLVLIQDPVSGEMCYCSVMGSLGEVVAMHAYIGIESYRLFHRLVTEETIDPNDFLIMQRAVSTEFVARSVLQPVDRKLLADLGHPVGRGLASPVFRAMRPGFQPWFVTEEEAQMLELCMAAIIAVCVSVVKEPEYDYWDGPDTHPLLSRVSTPGGKTRFEVKPQRISLPCQPPLAPARLSEAQLAQISGHDYPVSGTIELDYVVSPAAVGGRNERKACTCIGLAVSAGSGFLFQPELASPTVPVADVLTAALLKVIQSTRTFPQEVRIRNPRFKDALAPFSSATGVPIKVIGSLPALEEGLEALLGALKGRGFLSA